MSSTTYTQILYQIVFGTKYRRNTLIESSRPLLYKHIWEIIKNRNCHVYRIGGIENHVHIIMHLHPSVALASLIKEIKISSAIYIKANNIFPDFTGWQRGYGAFTYSISAKNNLIKYVKNQKAHHNNETFEKEYKRLLSEHQIKFNKNHL